MEAFENISRILTGKRLCQSEVLNGFFSLSDCIVSFGPFTVENCIRFFFDCFGPSFDGFMNVRSLIGKFGELHQIFRFKRVGLRSGKSSTPLDIGLKFVDFIGVNWIHVMEII
jgi:hypothetical protein